MNITLYALFTSYLSTSPMILLPQSFEKQSIRVDKSFAHNCFTSFLYTHTNNLNALIYQTIFNSFLQSTLSFRSQADTSGCEKEIVKVNYNQEQLTFKSCQTKEVKVVDCTFEGSNVGNMQGAGIYYNLDGGSLTVHGTIFNHCSAFSGAAIYAIASNVMTDFNSHYCCYFECSASTNNGGLGSAGHIAANDIQINYSTILTCKGYGAQMDLDSQHSIATSSINVTSCESTYCASLEYRNAQTGYFQYQTICKNKGIFITSFSGLKHDVEISNCNFVTATVIATPSGDSTSVSSVIHQRTHAVNLHRFFFYDIDLQAPNAKLISLHNDVTTTPQVYDSYVDLANCDLSNVETHNVVILADGKLPTHTIRQLSLGECKADVIKTVPPIDKPDDDDNPMPDDDQNHHSSNEEPNDPPKEDPNDPPKEDTSDPPKEDTSDPPKEDTSDPPKEDTSDPPKEDTSDPPKEDTSDPPSNDPNDPSHNSEHNPVEVSDDGSSHDEKEPDSEEKDLESKPKKKKNNARMIAGVTVASVVAAGGATAGVVYYLYQKKHKVTAAIDDKNEDEMKETNDD